MWQKQVLWHWLPEHAKGQTHRMFPRSRRPIGPGDGWIYRYSIHEPPPGYVGPVPYCVVHSRVKG
jgi:hypothetical protein